MLHRKPEQGAGPRRGKDKPQRGATREGLLEAAVFQPGLEERGDVAQLRVADGTVDGGAARTKWWRQEKQVVPGVWCGMN